MVMIRKKGKAEKIAQDVMKKNGIQVQKPAKKNDIKLQTPYLQH